MGHQAVELFEGARIVEQLDSLAGRQLAGRVLALQPVGASPNLRTPIEIGKDVFRPHRVASCFDGLRLFPILQEFLEADGGQGMVEQLIDDSRRTGADVAPPSPPR